MEPSGNMNLSIQHPSLVIRVTFLRSTKLQERELYLQDPDTPRWPSSTNITASHHFPSGAIFATAVTCPTYPSFSRTNPIYQESSNVAVPSKAISLGARSYLRRHQRFDTGLNLGITISYAFGKRLTRPTNHSLQVVALGIVTEEDAAVRCRETT
jgi:hypothetical protein